MDELLARLKQQEKEAFDEVMRMYKKPIFNYLRQLTGNREIAEELAQDTFVKVYFKAPGLKAVDMGMFRSWLYTIASNLARSEFRKQKVRRMFSISPVGDGREPTPVYEPTYESKLIVEEILAGIPEKYRIPLVMKEIDNFSFEEIAQILRKPIGTVKSLVFRGKQHIRAKYEPLHGEKDA